MPSMQCSSEGFTCAQLECAPRKTPSVELNWESDSTSCTTEVATEKSTERSAAGCLQKKSWCAGESVETRKNCLFLEQGSVDLLQGPLQNHNFRSAPQATFYNPLKINRILWTPAWKPRKEYLQARRASSMHRQKIRPTHSSLTFS